MVKRFFTILLSVALPLLGFSQEKNDFAPNGDKFVYDVTADPESISANLLQILQKMPLVRIDALDQVTLAGLENITVYMDNVPLILPQGGIGEYIKSISANQIERIEIELNRRPSHQISSDGGIINLVTRKQKKDGLSVVASARTAISSHSGGNVMFNIKHKGFFFDGGYTYSLLDLADTELAYCKEDQTTSIATTGTIKTHKYNHNARLHAGLQLTNKDVAGLTYNPYTYSGRTNTYTISEGRFLPEVGKPAPTERYYTYIGDYRKEKYRYDNLSAYYRHTFKNNSTIALTYEYNYATQFAHHSKSYGTASTTETDISSYGGGYTQAKDLTQSHAIRIDAFVPLNQANSIEAGTRYSFGDIVWWKNLERYSAYLQYSLLLSRFHLTVGTSWERPYNIEIFKYTFINEETDELSLWYPYISMDYRITTNGWISLNYTLQRSMLQPSIMHIDQIRYKWLNKVDMNYRYTGRKLQAMANFIYQNCPRTVLHGETDYYPDRPTKPYIGMLNYEQMLFSLSASYALSASVRLYAAGTLIHQKYNKTTEYISNISEENLNNRKGIYGQIIAGGTFCFPKQFYLTASGGYYSPINMKGDDIELSNYFYRLNLSKELFKKQMVVSLYTTDFIRKHLSETRKEIEYRYVMPKGEIGISLTYQFLKN